MLVSKHSVHSALSAGEVELQPNFQKEGGLIGPQLLEGVAGKERSDFFREGGGCNFEIKK